MVLCSPDRPGAPKLDRRRLLGGGITLTTAVAGITPFSSGPSLASAQTPTSAFDPASFSITLDPIVDGLDRPVGFVDANDGTGRFFIVEQGGLVRIWTDGAVSDAPLLDISDRLSRGNEQGLLSIALHPKFPENQQCFIDYTDQDGNTQIERWRISGHDPNTADPGSAETILTVEQPFPNHNGGLLLFGPDDKLYIGLGDGGSQGDPNGNGQNLGTLLATILRIDIDSADDGLAYAIPPDNPFVSQQGARGEIWAYGLRNPWRFSFDRETGDCFIGDVGQDTYEEISFAPAGASGVDFGWSVLEADSCYRADGCDQTGLTPPIFSYTHAEGGCSVTGGNVYRGKASPSLRGVYLCADYCTGYLWGLGRGADGGWLASAPVETGLNPSSFAEDASGELSLVDLNGTIYRISAG